jgi:hypothetical protein
VSGRLQLRRGVVVSAEPLVVEVAGERRPAWADTALLGEMREGDGVVVNVAALDLGLGSGGFDVVHVNLSRGLEGGEGGDEHVMKLNYTSLQHPVEPVESTEPRPFLSAARRGEGSAERGQVAIPVAILPLHGQLAPAAWAVAQASPGLRVGYVQSGGGALPGSISRDVAELAECDLLGGHITAGAAYGGEHEALSTVGALAAAANRLGWEAILVGPGPGIIGSETEFGHGGMAALDSAHAALSLRLPTLISPRLSSSDPRERHRGLSHHTNTLLELLLAPVDVAIPDGYPDATAELEAAADNRHRLRTAPADLDAYAASGLPTTTMGRSLDEDPLFFAAPLAAGNLLGESSRR